MDTDVLKSSLKDAGRVAALIVVGIGITMNVLLLLPGVMYAVMLGEYTVIVVGVGISLLFWIGGWVLLHLMVHGRRQRRAAA